MFRAVRTQSRHDQPGVITAVDQKLVTDCRTKCLKIAHTNIGSRTWSAPQLNVDVPILHDKQYGFRLSEMVNDHLRPHDCALASANPIGPGVARLDRVFPRTRRQQPAS